jgi:hypothetical protein
MSDTEGNFKLFAPTYTQALRANVTKAKIGENKLARFRKKYLKLKLFISLGSSVIIYKLLL